MDIKKIIILALLVFMNLNVLFSQEKNNFTINPVNKWEETDRTNTYIISGEHSLDIENTNVWIYLQDNFRNLFLQYPPVEFIDENIWEASNISIGTGIRYVLAIQVNANGHKKLLKMAKDEHWSAINYETIKELPGYQKLSTFKLDSDALNKLAKKDDQQLVMQQPAKTKTYNNYLLITDFEDSDNKWRIQTWSHPGKLKVISGYKKLETISEQNGLSCAFIDLPMDSETKDGGWCGGGFVINFKEKSQSIAISNYSYLQFDMCIAKNSNLANTSIKLEGTANQSYPERRISDYSVQISTEWQTVRIPLAHFSQLMPNDRKDMKGVDLSSVSKLVTVSILDLNNKNTRGTLLLDNIRFIN